VLFKGADGKQCRVSAPAPVASRGSFEQARVASEQLPAHPSQARAFTNNGPSPGVRALKLQLPAEAWANVRK
jgi:hypothetical protein